MQARGRVIDEMSWIPRWRAVCRGDGMDAFRTETVVLVAEDDPHALSGYLEFLGRSGFAASGSADGQEALGIAVETVPDIVVTDINMPGLNGFGLAAALRADQRTRHVPIVGMTAHWTADIQSEAQRAGFSAMLLKPCLPDHLLAEVERVLYAHPAVQEAAVVGQPDPEWGEIVAAFIQLRPASRASADELIEHCRAHLASYKKPRIVKFLPELPRTTSGKIAKQLLRVTT